ncbi:MAG TPA: hypothetical protein VMX55_09950 [candidate division Zixibacteria bacterium]|nr:hypothetical protein [candidate division Zixibacteria bacterium]
MIKEFELYPVVEELLIKEGYCFYKEVKVLTRSIDIIAVKNKKAIIIKKKKVIAIEVKVENWKKALQQALTCRLCAHEVYIAIWKDYHHRIPRRLLKKYRVGLILITENEASFLYKPRKSKIVHRNIMNNMLDMI